jgi:hypothetical protein
MTLNMANSNLGTHMLKPVLVRCSDLEVIYLKDFIHKKACHRYEYRLSSL